MGVFREDGFIGDIRASQGGHLVPAIANGGFAIRTVVPKIMPGKWVGQERIEGPSGEHDTNAPDANPSGGAIGLPV